jgi:hypothetical protein
MYDMHLNNMVNVSLTLTDWHLKKKLTTNAIKHFLVACEERCSDSNLYKILSNKCKFSSVNIEII